MFWLSRVPAVYWYQSWQSSESYQLYTTGINYRVCKSGYVKLILGMEKDAQVKDISPSHGKPQLIWWKEFNQSTTN